MLKTRHTRFLFVPVLSKMEFRVLSGIFYCVLIDDTTMSLFVRVDTNCI